MVVIPHITATVPIVNMMRIMDIGVIQIMIVVMMAIVKGPTIRNVILKRVVVHTVVMIAMITAVMTATIAMTVARNPIGKRARNATAVKSGNIAQNLIIVQTNRGHPVVNLIVEMTLRQVLL